MKNCVKNPFIFFEKITKKLKTERIKKREGIKKKNKEIHSNWKQIDHLNDKRASSRKINALLKIFVLEIFLDWEFRQKLRMKFLSFFSNSQDHLGQSIWVGPLLKFFFINCRFGSSCFHQWSDLPTVRRVCHKIKEC